MSVSLYASSALTFHCRQVNSVYTPCLKKTVQNYFCHNFVKFPATLIISGTQIAQRIGLCEVHSFSTSPN